MEKEVLKIFVDEAGNSGDDLISDQPYFVISAVSISNKKIPFVEVELKKLKLKFNFLPEQEIKTKSVYDTKNNKYLEAVYNLLAEVESDIFFTVLERKFMICARIVEDLFDPLYNKNTDNRWTHPIKEKTDIANFFYENLSVDAINLRAIAFQKGNLNDILKAFNLITFELKNLTFYLNLNELLKGIEDNLSDLSNDKLLSSENFVKDFEAANGVLHSPNLTTFYSLINKIENFYKKNNINAQLIFDNSRQFNSAFENWFGQLKKVKRSEILIGSTNLIFGYEKITEFIVKDSKLET